ncbi:hypothetical protein D3C72_987760 [compost metagenome]
MPHLSSQGSDAAEAEESLAVVLTAVATHPRHKKLKSIWREVTELAVVSGNVSAIRANVRVLVDAALKKGSQDIAIEITEVAWNRLANSNCAADYFTSVLADIGCLCEHFHLTDRYIALSASLGTKSVPLEKRKWMTQMHSQLDCQNSSKGSDSYVRQNPVLL